MMRLACRLCKRIKFVLLSVLVFGTVFLFYHILHHYGTYRPVLFSSELPEMAVQTQRKHYEPGFGLKSRRKTLKNMCNTLDMNSSSYGPDRLSHLEHLIYNDDKKILYCFVPKVACTNFRRVFLALEGVVSRKDVQKVEGYDVYVTYQDRLKTLADLSVPERVHRLKTYRKFLFVREPFERFFSAYTSKFFHPNPVNVASFLGKISEFYQEHPHLRNRVRKNTISLSDFLYHIAHDKVRTGDFVNEHFNSVWKLCHPCHVDYDFIGKYENLQDDVAYIFNHLNIDVPFPARADNFSELMTKDVAPSHYVNVPESYRQMLWEFLKLDYAIFGYDKPDFFH